MGEMFSEAFLEHVKHAVPISEVVGQYVVWDKSKSRDGDMWACCPFHSEGDPSFHALEKDGFYKCFSCGAQGDHFEFLTKNQGMSFPDAVRLVAELGGVSLPDTPSPAPRRESAKPQEQKPETQSKSAARKACKREAVATYDYTDNDGNLLYQVVRYQFKKTDGSWLLAPSGNPDKTFLQRREVNGETVWNLDGVGHTIYRHPQIEIAIAESKPVFIVEGEKDVETLEGFGLIATTNSGGVENWDKKHAAMFKGASVIIIGDNDEAGIAGVLKRATSLKGIAQRVRVLDLGKAVSGFPNKGDITDWRDKFGGDKAALIEMVKALPDWRQGPPVSRFNAVGLHELNQKRLQHDFLIDGFLDRQGVAMMPGASGSGKTFITLELAMCVSLNRDFWGLPVKPGLVIYQAGEGAPGAAKRMEGWMQDREIPVDDRAAIPFKMIPRKVNLFVDDKDTDDLIAECQAWSEYFEQPVRLVIIDTFNKAITGANENAGQDMGKVMSRLERISEVLNCLVLVPMHKSKQGDMRGHTSLMGDACNVLNVSELQIRDQNRRIIRTVALDKNKDGEKGTPLRFVLRVVAMPDDENGKPRSTCVVDRPDGDDDLLAQQGKLSLDHVLILRILKQSIDRDGVEAPTGLRGARNGQRVVEQKIWQDAIRREWFFKSPESDHDKRAKELRDLISRTGKVLKSAGYMDRDEIGPDDARKSYVWWTGKQDRAVATPKPVADALPAGINAEISEAAKAGVPFI